MRIVSIGNLLVGVLVGVLLGTMLFRPATTRAQDWQEIYIDQVPAMGRNVVTGSQIVGFSCIQKSPLPGEKLIGGSTWCFVASTR